MRATRRSQTTTIVALLLTVACGDVGGPSEQPATVSLSAPSTELTVGGTVQLAAAVLNSTGAMMSGQQLQWSSLDEAVASVSPAGLVTGLAGGTARIRATAGTAAGTIMLSVRPADCSRTSIAGTITTGQTVTGSLTAADCMLLGSDHADGWSFSVTQATGVRFSLRSGQFEAVLVVSDLAMNFIAYASVGGDGTANVVHEFAPGSYIVWVTSWGSGTTGAYTLSAETMTMCSAATTAGSLALDQTVTGALTPASCILPHGYTGVGWRISPSAGMTVRVSMQATGFVPLLVATDLYLHPVAFGMPAGPDNAVEFVHAFMPGEYLIWATSADGGTGSFSVSMAEARFEPCPPAGTITPGQTMAGAIGYSSCRLPDGRFADAWQLTLADAAPLRIDMTSTQLDAYLIVTDQHGSILAVDDDGGVGTNARLVYQFPAGSYTVLATTYAPAEIGAYQLAVQPVTSGSLGERPRVAPAKPAWPARRTY